MNAISERIGWTLLHSLWEGGLIWIGFRLVLLGLRRSSAQARYLAGLLALGLTVLVTALTFLRLGAHIVALPPSPGGVGATPPALPATYFTGYGPRIAPLSSSTVLESLLPWLVVGWGFGCVWGSISLAIDWAVARRLHAGSLRPLSEDLIQRCQALAQRLGVQRAIRMGESALVEVPALVGWIKPVILIPVEAFSGLTPDQIDAILAHELAHVLRHDFPVNLLQSVCDVLFFYHPAVWAINASIRFERENACDDIAVAVTGDSVGYAAALLQLEEARAPRLALAASGSSQLLRRVRRLLAAPIRTRGYANTAAWSALIAVGLCAAVVFVAGSVVHAAPDGGTGLHAETGFFEVSALPAPGFTAVTLAGGYPPRTETLYIADIPDLTLSDIARAFLRGNQQGDPYLQLNFTPQGQIKFQTLTRARTAGGRVAREALVANGVVLGAPTINQEITGPSAVMEGHNTPHWRAEIEAFARSIPASP